MSERYYQLLGVTSQAAMEEIKRAYRSRALQLHPDRNPSPDAQQQFIELTEAYEYVVAEKNGRFKKYTSPFDHAEQVAKARREEAVRKAREYARMRYEEFEKTEAFQTINSLNIILDHFIFLFACGLLAAVPLALTYFYNVTGFALGGLFLLTIARPVFGFIKPYFNPSQLWIAVMGLVETFFFRIIILSIANMYLFLKIGLQTMLPVTITLSVIIVPALLAYFIFYRKKESSVRSFVSFCLIPLIVNGMLLINFWGSRNPVVEEYEFWNEHERTRTGQRKNTLIHLENKAYEDYLGIRVFSNIDQMKYSTHIVYQFEDGLLGIRVMKEYRFID